MSVNMIYLIDTENVSSGGFVGVEYLLNTEKIYYFYSARSYRPSYPEIKRLRKAKCKIEIIESVTPGSNSLDFQIVTFLGNLIGKSKKHGEIEYIIVSNDTGFDAAVKFWKERGEKVSRRESIGDYSPILIGETQEIIENNDEALEKAYNQLSSVNKRKLNYPKIVTLAALKLPKDRYSLVLSSIYKSGTAQEFEKKIRVIPNSQINERKKNAICEMVMKDFREFKKY